MNNKISSEVLISVIVPTYKRGGKYLARCIDSLMNQSYPHIEIIVVDDNIPGDSHNETTKKTIENYQYKNKINYVETAGNLGAALARNCGINAAKGEYTTFLDDDDEYLRDKVSVQLKYMIDNNLDMSFTDIGLYNEDGQLVEYRSHDYLNDLSNSELIKQHVMHNLTGTPTYMFRTEKLKEIGGFDDSILSEEYYLMEKSINSGLKIGYIPSSYVMAYRHKDGGESFSDRKIAGEKLLFSKKKEYFNLLTGRQRRYTRCRYYAVMAISNYRRHRFLRFALYSFLSVVVSPVSVIKELKKRNQLLEKHKKTYE